ncbi:MAG: nuclear transport factor 2 family protein [Cyanobacteria bacterium P01_F01_bin.3]
MSRQNQMPQQALTNTQTVQKFFEAQYAGDFDLAFQAYAQPHFQWVVASSSNEALRAAIPWAGYIHQGKEGYIRLMSLLFSEFEALEFEPSRYTDAGDRVFVEGHFVFRHRTTGKIADSDWVARFDMDTGRIAGGQFYENTASIAEERRAA